MPSPPSESFAEVRAEKSREPHPFYIFTTIGLAFFLGGIALWPAGAPRFECHSVIRLRWTGDAPAGSAIGDHLAAIARQMEQEELSPAPITESGLAWRLEEDQANHGLAWQLSLTGASPEGAHQRLTALTDRALSHLDGINRSEARSETGAVATSSEGGVTAIPVSTIQQHFVAWISDPPRVAIMAGRSVTPSQVIFLGTLSCGLAAAFTVYALSSAPTPAEPDPTTLAQELDLPVLGVLGPRNGEAMYAPASVIRWTWRWAALRLGEACVVFAFAITAFQAARSHEMRELFLTDPLTLFRSVVRPTSTAEMDHRPAATCRFQAAVPNLIVCDAKVISERPNPLFIASCNTNV